MADHPDFTSAPDKARWTEGNRGLFVHLETAAFQSRGAWVGVVVPNGTWLEMRIRPELAYRPELRIRRTTTPSPESWAAQVETVIKRLTPDRGRRWDVPHPAAVDAPGVAVTMLVLFFNETGLGVVECAGAGCSNQIPAGARADQVLCAECAASWPSDAARESRGAEPHQVGLRLEP